MAKLMLAEVTEGLVVRTLALLRQKRLIPFKNKPGHFLALTLSDRSGSLDAKLFDGAEEASAALKEGAVVRLAGRAETYQGVLGLVLDAVAPAVGPVDKADFMPAYAGDVSALVAQLDALIDSVTDPDLSALLRSLLRDPEIRARYCEAPAARQMHGAYLSGLLEHVVRQAALADAACRCFPRANRDLVIAGVLLHDVGKIEEFSWELSIEYTTIGRLLGHIVLGDRLVFERGRELGMAEEVALQLRHLILSHHGIPEFGAVAKPQTLEAVILHSVDNLEAKATHCLEMMRAGDASSPWTDYDRIEERYWYRGDAVMADARRP